MRSALRGRALTLAAAALAVPALAAAPAMAAAGAAGPGWRVVQVGAVNSQFYGLAASGPANAWAVGTSCGNPCQATSLLVEHWNGSGWAAIPPPSGFPTTVGTAHVSSDGPGDTWVFPGYGNNVDRTAALHWNGTRWSARTTFPKWTMIGSSVTVGKADAWAFGMIISPFSAYAAHFNGKGWKRVRFPLVQVQASATSARDIWVTGETDTKRSKVAVLRYNGRAWRTMRLPRIHLPSGDRLQSGDIAAVSARDVWVDAFPTHGQGLAPGIVLLHWNGRTWARIKVPYASTAPNYLAPDGRGGLWLSSYNSKFAPVLYHYRAGRWRRQAVPSPSGDSTQLAAMAAIPGSRSVWGAGSASPYPNNPNGLAQAVLLKDGP